MSETTDVSPDPAKVKEATAAMLGALSRLGIEDTGVCITAVSVLLGCLVTASDNPENALASANKVARGIMDGSLLL